jgi:hypothetical protein
MYLMADLLSLYSQGTKEFTQLIGNSNPRK